MSLWLKSRISRWISSSNSARRFSPLDIPNLVAWYRADLGITLNGADVSDWADQSGNGNHISQATAANQPLFNASDVDFNNNSSVEGDGVSELLRRTAFVTGAIPQPNTLVIVYKMDDNVGVQNLCNSGTASARQALFAVDTDFRMFASTAQSIHTADTNTHTLIGLFNGASSNSWLDGVAGTPAGTVGTEAMNGLTLFANDISLAWVNGKIAEFAVYDRDLTNAEKNPFGNYAADRYGLTWTDI